MLAYLLNLCGWLLLPFMDGIAKYLSTELHFLQVVWGRYFFMLLISIPVALIFFRHELKFPNSISFFSKQSLAIVIIKCIRFSGVGKFSISIGKIKLLTELIKFIWSV